MRARLKPNASINALMVGDLKLGREWVHVPTDLEGAIRYWAPTYGIEVDEQANTMAVMEVKAAPRADTIETVEAKATLQADTMETRGAEAAPIDPNPVPGAQKPESPRPPANLPLRRRGGR